MRCKPRLERALIYHVTIHSTHTRTRMSIELRVSVCFACSLSLSLFLSVSLSVFVCVCVCVYMHTLKHTHIRARISWSELPKEMHICEASTYLASSPEPFPVGCCCVFSATEAENYVRESREDTLQSLHCLSTHHQQRLLHADNKLQEQRVKENHAVTRPSPCNLSP